MTISKHVSLIVLAGLLGTVLTQEGCGSDPSAPTGPGAAGSSGAASSTAGAGVGGGSSGMASTTAGAPGAGAPSAGAPASGGGGAGGSAAGAGGSAAGAGGSAAGSGGTGGGSAGSGGKAGGGSGGGSAGMGTGGSSASFMAVKTLFGASCGVGTCHNATSMNLDYQGTKDLHGMLTKPIPTGVAHCVGSTLVTPNDTNSFLVTVVKMGGSCPTGGGTIGKMPDNCGQAGKPACLTDTQVKIITDWIAAGAPN